MNWRGLWRNQYGSTVRITRDDDGRIEGVFRTALETSALFGMDAPITGFHRGRMISFVAAGDASAGIVVSYTGLLEDGRMETLWHLVAQEKLSADGEGKPAKKRALQWWEATNTGADTFLRASES